MNTQRIRPWPLLLASLLFFVSCAKRPCGEMLSEAPQSIADLEWKLTKSSDREVNEDLTPFTFTVFKFERTGNGSRGYYGEELLDGTIRRAESNIIEEMERARTFRYSLLGPGFMYFELLPAEPTEEPIEKEYTYELDRKGLSLQDLESGQVYTFCPFNGAEAPEAAFNGSN